jgi:hypothetical protein
MKPDFKQLAINLLLGMEKWGRDEDGIHPDAWDAYKEAREALGAKAQWDDENTELSFDKSLHAELREEGKT